MIRPGRRRRERKRQQAESRKCKNRTIDTTHDQELLVLEDDPTARGKTGDIRPKGLDTDARPRLGIRFVIC